MYDGDREGRISSDARRHPVDRIRSLIADSYWKRRSRGEDKKGGDSGNVERKEGRLLADVVPETG